MQGATMSGSSGGPRSHASIISAKYATPDQHFQSAILVLRANDTHLLVLLWVCMDRLGAVLDHERGVDNRYNACMVVPPQRPDRRHRLIVLLQPTISLHPTWMYQCTLTTMKSVNMDQNTALS